MPKHMADHTAPMMDTAKRAGGLAETATHHKMFREGMSMSGKGQAAMDACGGIQDNPPAKASKMRGFMDRDIDPIADAAAAGDVAAKRVLQLYDEAGAQDFPFESSPSTAAKYNKATRAAAHYLKREPTK